MLFFKITFKFVDLCVSRIRFSYIQRKKKKKKQEDERMKGKFRIIFTG
jgi:hypothetical protein